MLMQSRVLIVALAAALVNIVASIPINEPAAAAEVQTVVDNNSDEFSFILLHNNDMHARFEEIYNMSKSCTAELQQENQCFGGFARQVHVIREYREKAKNPHAKPILYLNAGDTFTGTPWFAIYKHEMSSKFMNLLEPDAVTLGNHEFDLGVKQLARYIKSLKTPVVVSNLDVSKEPKMKNIQNLHENILLEIGGRKIGIVGYVTPTTMFQASVGGVKILPEIDAVNKQTQILKEQGVNIIIALGHSGIDVDRDIAKHCPDVDIVVGAHSHTFLYTGNQPDSDIAVDTYPVVIEQDVTGKRVPVVQAFAYTKYLGHLDVTFNSVGDLIRWDGNPILLDYSVPQDADVLELLEEYRPGLLTLTKPIGEVITPLKGTKTACRLGECNLGNLITDAMIYAYSTQQTSLSDFPDVKIAVVQGGGIKSTIHAGNVSELDILTAVPYNNTLVLANITGENLLQALQHSASFYDVEENGGFLQFSGLIVTYNMSRPIGKRVVSIKVRCAACAEETFKPIDTSETYPILFPIFLYKGGDQYKWTNDPHPMRSAIVLNDWTDSIAIREFIKVNSPINYRLENRQVILS